MKRSQPTVWAAGALIMALWLSACGSSTPSHNAASKETSSASRSGCSSPGVTADTIKVGEISTLSGQVAAFYKPVVKGWRAGIKAQNDAGGVNGRKIKLIAADDAGSTTQAVTAAQQLVNRDHVFATLMGEPVTSGSAKVFADAGVPVAGYNTTPDWGKYKNMFGYSGSSSVKPVATTTLGKFFKSQGVKSLAIIGSTNPSAKSAAKTTAASFKAVGGKVALVSTSAAIDNTNWLPQAQKTKKSGADGVYTPLITQSAVQILDALHKVGVHPKVVLLPAGYGQATLKQLGASANGLSFSTDFVPFQASNDKAHRQAKAAFKKYAPGTAISDTLVDGYLSAQMLIKGLKLAGADCPSQKAFIHKLRNVTSYTAGGFFDPPINLKTTFGKPYGLCFHFTEVRHQKFVPLNHGDATCGKVVK